MTPRRRDGGPKPRTAATPAPASARASPAPSLLIAALALGFALRAAASFAPFHGAWGLDTLKPWPRAWAVAIVALGALGFVPLVARLIEHALDGIGALWERGGAVFDALVAFTVAALLFNLRDPIKFTGDFSTRVSQLVLKAPTEKVFPQAMPLDRWINIELPRRLMSDLNLDVMRALHTAGALVGFAFVLAAFAFLRAAGATRAMLPAAAAVILGGGYMLHFAGYDKFGPLLLGVAIVSTGAVRLARTGRDAWAVGLGLAVCVLAHRSGYALAPAAALVLAQAWRGARNARARLHIAGAAALMSAAVLGLMSRTWKLLNSVDRLQALPGAPQGGGPPLHGFADAALRVTDTANLLFLVAPLWLAGLAAALVARGAPAPRETPRFSLVPAAILALCGELALVLAVRGAQGVARDWDTHVAPAAFVSLLTVFLLIAVWQRAGAARSLAPTVTTALASAVALWGIHLNEPIAITRVGQLLENRSSWSDAAWARAHDYLGVRALQMQRADLAIPEFLAAISVAPNPRFFFEVGIAHRMLGHKADARAYFDKAHALDPTLSDPWVGFALLAVDAGEFAPAAAFCESALAISPHRTDAKQIRDTALQALVERRPPASPFQ